MSDVDSKIESIEKDIQYFDKMVNGAEKLVRPWKHIAIALAIALVLSNAIWGAVHGYAIFKAYQEPNVYEQQQSFDEKTQSQSSKGSAN